MLLSSEVLLNLFRPFGNAGNPWMDAFKSGPLGGSTPPQAVPASPAGATEMLEAIRQTLDAQVGLIHSVASCALASTEKLIELNMNAARTSTQENATLAAQLLASTSAADLQAICAALPQATSTKAIAYGRHVTSIAAQACTEIARSTHAEVVDMTDRLGRLVDQASKSLPVGSENLAALTKSAIATAGSGYEQVVKTAEQTAHTLQENAENIVNNAVQTTARTSSGNGSKQSH